MIVNENNAANYTRNRTTRSASLSFPVRLKVILLILIFLPVKSFPQIQTNAGQDFWIAFPPNVGFYSIKLFISSEVSTSGTVSSAFPGVNQNFTVTPGLVTEVILPPEVQLSGYIENKGIHVTANDPVAVYGLNLKPASSDAYLALPVPSLGNDYWIMTYKTTPGGGETGMAVVATENGTTVTIFNAVTGATQDINLQQGQTYFVSAFNVGSDYTGSHIQSNFPVAVFGTVRAAFIPENCSAADHLVEQMQPVVSWGTNYVTVATAGRDNSGDMYRVLASQDNTQVSVNGSMAAMLNQGEFYETYLAGNNSFTADKPVCVAQFAKGFSCSGNITGDPFMILIPPREQFLAHYTVGTVAGFDYHFVNVVAPDYATGAIYEDGILIPAGEFTSIGSTGFSGAQRAVSEGSHTFSGIHPFGVFMYGWNPADSYGYAGGQSMSPVGLVDSINLEPNTASGILNITNLCFTAHVLSNVLSPVAGILVSFHISGVNPLSGTAFTNNNGDATFCYTQTGFTPGIDQVYAEVIGISSDTALVTWSNLPCENPSDAGTIGYDQSGCTGFIPAVITSLTPPSGYTGNLQYLWQSSTTGPTSGFGDIAGSGGESWAPGPVQGTTWFRRLVRVDCKPDWAGAAISNTVIITALPFSSPEIVISASALVVCQGTPVNFSATFTLGGGQPLFQWKVNGTATGTNSPSFTYIPTNGDVVTCFLTSSEPCPLVNPVNSNSLTLNVNPLLPVSVFITALANPVCQGTSAVLTATGVNAGSFPQYQWKVNGVNTGTGSTVYSYIPAQGDGVTCILTSSEACATGNPATGNTVTMATKPLPQVTFAPCFDTITRVNAQPFRLRGGLPFGGIYSGPGVNSATGIFDPATAGPGNHPITYSYTNIATCTSSATTHVFNFPSSIFICGSILTDPRDGKTYPTVQLGSRCWMQKNLDYGTAIPSTIPQTDNCLPERYLHPSALVLPSSCYQWDELMTYETTGGSRGLCPPGWHVPLESEWMNLQELYLGASQAGRPLQDTVLNGFRALQRGINYMNSSWSFDGFATFFWTSSEWNTQHAVSHGMNVVNHSVSFYNSSKANAFPVRCICD